VRGTQKTDQERCRVGARQPAKAPSRNSLYGKNPSDIRDSPRPGVKLAIEGISESLADLPWEWPQRWVDPGLRRLFERPPVWGAPYDWRKDGI
jgi:hypothetical protein